MTSQPAVNIKSSVQFHFDCNTCGNFGHFWVDPKRLKDGQIRADGTCDVCENAVAGFSEERVMPKDKFMQEVLADVANTRPEHARVMAKMAMEREQSLELRNLLRRPFAIVIGTALLLALAGVAAIYAFGEQSKGAQYVQMAASAVLWLVGCWAVFRGRSS